MEPNELRLAEARTCNIFLFFSIWESLLNSCGGGTGLASYDGIDGGGGGERGGGRGRGGGGGREGVRRGREGDKRGIRCVRGKERLEELKKLKQKSK